MRALIIDDDITNLNILEESLEDEGFEVVRAEDGHIAWEFLQNDQNIDIILLDRMMPTMSGMEFLTKIKDVDKVKDIPIIMQTAAATSQEIREGVNAGVFYYLTKPFETEVLVSIVNAAIEDYRAKQKMHEEVYKSKYVLTLMQDSHYTFRTLEEAKNLSYFLANCFPEPDKIVVGLSELLINAVEHGNLGITFDEKTNLLEEGIWLEEIERRASLPEYMEKSVNVEFIRTKDEIRLTITDEGDGFDSTPFLDLTPERATNPNGRGVAMANLFSFDRLEYNDKGNQVTCIEKL